LVSPSSIWCTKRLYFDANRKQLSGAVAFGQTFNALNGGEQHPAIQAVKRSVGMMGFFYYVAWGAKVLRMLPPTEEMKKSRLALLHVRASSYPFWHQFSKAAMEKLIGSDDDDRSVNRTIMGNFMDTTDPRTGQQFTTVDLYTQGSTFL
jgi:hypothetical protein